MNPPLVATPDASAQEFGRTFSLLHAIEMRERLAYHRRRVMAPIYIMQAGNPGGLPLTALNKGTIYAWWTAFQSLLPMITGGSADRFGYKRTLGIAGGLMTARLGTRSPPAPGWSGAQPSEAEEAEPRAQ